MATAAAKAKKAAKDRERRAKNGAKIRERERERERKRKRAGASTEKDQAALNATIMHMRSLEYFMAQVAAMGGENYKHDCGEQLQQQQEARDTVDGEASGEKPSM
jgi:hypothetical protein